MNHGNHMARKANRIIWHIRPKRAKVGREGIADHCIIWHEGPKRAKVGREGIADHRIIWHEGQYCKVRSHRHGQKVWDRVILGNRLPCHLGQRGQDHVILGKRSGPCHLGQPCHLGEKVRTVSSWASSPVGSGEREVTSIVDHQ